MPMLPARRRVGQVVEEFWTANMTSGGSMETPTVKEEAAGTSLVPSTSAESAATPQGKCPKVSRGGPGWAHRW